MSETVESAQIAEAGATKSALKSTTLKGGRRASARKVVISDNPLNQTSKSSGATMRQMGQSQKSENAMKST